MLYGRQKIINLNAPDNKYVMVICFPPSVHDVSFIVYAGGCACVWDSHPPLIPSLRDDGSVCCYCFSAFSQRNYLFLSNFYSSVEHFDGILCQVDWASGKA